MTYPKWLYHKEIKPEGKVIYSEQEFEKLESGWVDSPALFESETPKRVGKDEKLVEKAQCSKAEKQDQAANESAPSEAKANTEISDSEKADQKVESGSYHDHMDKWPSKKEKESNSKKEKAEKTESKSVQKRKAITKAEAK